MEIAARRPKPNPETSKAVWKILADIEKNGVRAAVKYAKRFDSPKISLKNIAVSSKEIRTARLATREHDAIVKSIERVTQFHYQQLTALTRGWKKAKLWGETRIWEWRTPARKDAAAEATGFEGQRLIPVNRVGLYVPGGKAAYPSSVIMNAVPAIVAGVGELCVCTPALPDGSVHPAILVAARELGIEQIAKVGGAAAIAFMAHGDTTEEFWSDKNPWLRCDLVCGPGNAWVNEAKRQLWGSVGLDSYAGPSEVCVLVDETANARFAAADLLTQIEHSEDNFAVLVSTNRDKADEILAEAEKQLAGSPREAIMRKALKEKGICFVVKKLYEASMKGSSIASEHLSCMVGELEQAASYIKSAGCILLGDYTPQSAGDFVSGPSHTLPTNLGARFASPVNVMTFLKFQSISCLTKEDLAELRPTIEAFAEMEGFPQHGRGASIRFEDEAR
ncbi:MAG: histidinol dehydrogenase [Armatimonadetes bacterium]|nr:histidinol dehydrogenase [Armatimonadota bacterium]